MSGMDKPVSSGASDERPVQRTGATGHVRTPEGAPVGGALIAARSLDEPPKPIPEIGILSTADGSYLWPLRPGRYELTPTLDGRRGEAGEVVVVAGTVSTLDLTMPR